MKKSGPVDTEEKKPIREKISKRVIGAICLSIAIALGLILFYLSIHTSIADGEMAKYVTSTFFLVGLALLGIDTGGNVISSFRRKQ